MDRHENHEIDEMASRIFRDATPPAWVINPHTHDYGKDYHVEIAASGKMTGQSFYVQQKGQKKVTVRPEKGYVQFSLKTKYAAYYLDNVTDLPVFLVLIDVTARKGWWLFLQPFLRQDQTWRDKTKLTIKIPLSNDIEDSVAFSSAVTDAKKKMRMPHASSIQDAIAAQKERLESLDSRFEILTTADDQQVAHAIRPKSPVKVNFRLIGTDEAEVRRKAHDLLNRGLPIEFKPGELQVAGSALFEEIARQGGVLSMGWSNESELCLRAVDANQQEISRLDNIRGVVSGGKTEIRFDGGLSGSPFSIRTVLVFGSGAGTFNIELLFEKWEQKRLRQLPYFNQLYTFFSTIGGAERLYIDFIKQGNLVSTFPGTLPSETRTVFAEFMLDLYKARRVCELVDIDPLWTIDSYDADAFYAVTELYDAFFKGGHHAPAPNCTLTFDIDSMGVDNLKGCQSQTFSSEGEQRYEILGVPFKASVRRELTNIRFVSSTMREGGERCDVVMKGNEHTQLSVTQAIL